MYYVLGFLKAYIRGEIALSGAESVMSVTGALRVSHSDEDTTPAGTDIHKSFTQKYKV